MYRIGRTFKSYVSKVYGEDGDNLKVFCLRRDRKLKKDVSGFYFPKTMDANLISDYQILKELPEPTKPEENFIFPFGTFIGLTIY